MRMWDIYLSDRHPRKRGRLCKSQPGREGGSARNRRYAIGVVDEKRQLSRRRERPVESGMAR